MASAAPTWTNICVDGRPQYSPYCTYTAFLDTVFGELQWVMDKLWHCEFLSPTRSSQFTAHVAFSGIGCLLATSALILSTLIRFFVFRSLHSTFYFVRSVYIIASCISRVPQICVRPTLHLRHGTVACKDFWRISQLSDRPTAQRVITGNQRFDSSTPFPRWHASKFHPQ